MKKLVLILFFVLLFKPVVFSANDNCYVVIEDSDKYNPEFLTSISISLISQYLKNVKNIPPQGLPEGSCIYRISVTKVEDTTFVTFAGDNLNSFGDSKLEGIDGFKHSILKSLFRSLRRYRNLICLDYGELLSDECKTIDKNDVREKIEQITLSEKKDEMELSGFFISVGNLCNILKSENGKDWEVVNNEGCKRLLGVTRGNNKLITVGISGTILSSEDGLDWYFDEIDTNNDLNEIYFHNNIFIIVGGDGIILVSQNGDSWEEVDSGVSDDLFDVTFFNGEFIVVGEDGTILVSSNGRNWEKVDSNTSNDLSGVTNSKKIIVTGGEDGIILHSKDNRNWSKSKKSIQKDIFGVYFEKKLFFTVGKGGIQQSKNGKAWKSIKLDNNKFIRGLVYGNNKFVSVGDHGTIFISDNGKKWEPTISNTKWNIQEVNFFYN